MSAQGLDWVAAIALFGGIQGIILVFALLASPKGNRQANRFLILFLIAFSIQIFDYIYVYTQSFKVFPHALYLSDCFILAVPYLFYRYVRTLARRHVLFRFRELFHLIPSGGYLINAIPFYLQNGSYKVQYKLNVAHQEFPVRVPTDNFTVGSAVILGVVYLVLCAIEIKQLNHRLKRVFSSIEAIQLRWLIHLLAGLVMILIIAGYYFLTDHPEETDIVIPFSMTILMSIIGYMGIRQPEVFYRAELADVVHEVVDRDLSIDKIASTDLENKSKYERSSLKQDQVERYLEQLTQLMEQEKAYRQSDLNLLMLANQMGISTHHLSQLLNGHLHQSFFDLVNGYRIEDAKTRLLDSTFTGNFLDIVYQSGFNSKSSFYNSFKKHTGMTPTQFKQSAIKSIG